MASRGRSTRPTSATLSRAGASKGCRGSSAKLVQQARKLRRLDIAHAAQHDLSFPVEEHDRRGTAHLKPRRQLLFREHGAVGPRDVAVAADVQAQTNERCSRSSTAGSRNVTLVMRWQYGQPSSQK